MIETRVPNRWVELAVTKYFLDHPDEWIEKELGCKLWEIQREIVRSVYQNSRTSVRSCTGSGKSFIAARAAVAFLLMHYPSTVITTAPTFRQVESILWREIRMAYGKCRIDLGGELKMTSINIEENWFAIGLSTDEPERFQGLHNKNVLCIGDEASGLSPSVYAAIENPLATGNAHLLLIGNPTQPSGNFRDTFESNLYNHIHISAFDTPNFEGLEVEDFRTGNWKAKVQNPLPYPFLITPQWVAERLEEWGESSFLWQVYVMGEFPEGGENNLFRWPDIEAAVGRDVSEAGELLGGLDIARYGDSETVYITRKGDKVLSIDSWAHQDVLQTAGRMARLLRQKSPIAVRIDATAIGQDDGVILRKEGFNIEDVLVGNPAVDSEVFANRKAELYFMLKKKFEDGTISIPDDRKLMKELGEIRYHFHPRTGKYIIESKEEMRARGVKSPDRADALVLAFIPRYNSSGPIRVTRFG